MGLDRGIPNNVFKILHSAFESYTSMKQINGKAGNNTANFLSDYINKAMKDTSNIHRLLTDFFLRVQLMSLPQFETLLKNNS